MDSTEDNVLLDEQENSNLQFPEVYQQPEEDVSFIIMFIYFRNVLTSCGNNFFLLFGFCECCLHISVMKMASKAR